MWLAFARELRRIRVFASQNSPAISGIIRNISQHNIPTYRRRQGHLRNINVIVRQGVSQKTLRKIERHLAKVRNYTKSGA
jgi:hypothetical protein